MDNEINIFATVVNAAATLFLISAFAGVLIKLSTIAMAIIAYPVYLSLYALEIPLGAKKRNKRKVLSLNLPKENPKRLMMNFSAFMAFLFMLPNMSLLASAVGPQVAPKEQENIIISLIYSADSSRLWFNVLALFFIVIIYAISYFTEYDDRDPWDKIENLTIPSLWKTVVKNL